MSHYNKLSGNLSETFKFVELWNNMTTEMAKNLPLNVKQVKSVLSATEKGYSIKKKVYCASGKVITDWIVEFLSKLDESKTIKRENVSKLGQLLLSKSVMKVSTISSEYEFPTFVDSKDIYYEFVGNYSNIAMESLNTRKVKRESKLSIVRSKSITNFLSSRSEDEVSLSPEEVVPDPLLLSDFELHSNNLLHIPNCEQTTESFLEELEAEESRKRKNSFPKKLVRTFSRKKR
jgi:hypothetical protein